MSKGEKVGEWENVHRTNTEMPHLEEKDRKQDKDKLRYDLFPVEALEEITKVLNFGANKYAARSWEDGMKWGRCYAALMRHMFAWWMGEDKDKETGITHLAHAGCCLVFLITYEKRGMNNNDDRPITRYPEWNQGAK